MERIERSDPWYYQYGFSRFGFWVLLAIVFCAYIGGSLISPELHAHNAVIIAIKEERPTDEIANKIMVWKILKTTSDILEYSGAVTLGVGLSYFFWLCLTSMNGAKTIDPNSLNWPS